MPPPDLDELEQGLVTLVAGNERGMEAHAVHSALEEEKGISLTHDAFDELVLRLHQQDQIVEDRITNPNRRILRLRTAGEAETVVATTQELWREHLTRGDTP